MPCLRTVRRGGCHGSRGKRKVALSIMWAVAVALGAVACVLVVGERCITSSLEDLSEFVLAIPCGCSCCVRNGEVFRRVQVLKDPVRLLHQFLTRILAVKAQS